MEQRSSEWFAARMGRVTASMVSAVQMAPSSQGYRNYRAQLVMERLGIEVEEKYISPAMQWGIDVEPQARAMYSFAFDKDVEEVGFIQHPTLFAGASPDGLVGSDGMVEIKCPNTTTHIETLNSGEIKKEYLAQMQWQMICAGRKWCDFVSFDPRMPAAMQIYKQRVEIDAEETLTAAVTKFISEVDRMEAGLRQKYDLEKEAA